MNANRTSDESTSRRVMRDSNYELRATQSKYIRLCKLSLSECKDDLNY